MYALCLLIFYFPLVMPINRHFLQPSYCFSAWTRRSSMALNTWAQPAGRQSQRGWRKSSLVSHKPSNLSREPSVWGHRSVSYHNLFDTHQMNTQKTLSNKGYAILLSLTHS